MFAFILLICVFALFMASFIVLIMDLSSKKRNSNRPADEKLPKLGKYSFLFNLFALLLLVIVSFSYAY
jgi:Na+/H+ antiporter NhaC